jgi:hypothetical protein
MAQAVGELGEVALEVGEIEHRGTQVGCSDRISATG